MHTVVVRRELAKEHPEIVKAVCDAKQATTDQFVKGMTFNNMGVMIPWLTKRIEEDRHVLGDDWWPYWIEANRKAIDAILRCHHEQGLTQRRFTVEDISAPYLLDT